MSVVCKSDLLELLNGATERQMRNALDEVIKLRPADDDIVPPYGVKERVYTDSGSIESNNAAHYYNRHAIEVYAAIHESLTSDGVSV
jgi:hypothetical protein